MMQFSASTTACSFTTKPVSSRASRSAAERSVSPSSTMPPGSDHFPASGGWARRTSRTRPSSMMTAPTPTIGRSGYSRFIVISGEEVAWLHVSKLPAASRALSGKAELRVSALRRRRAVSQLQFHLHVYRGNAFAVFHRGFAHVEIHADGTIAIEKRYDLIFEGLASTHFGEIKDRERLVLHVALKPGTHLVE